MPDRPATYYVETLGCPKNQVDSDKLEGTLVADGLHAVGDASAADLLVVNTCAFVEEARQESIDTILALSEQRRPGARLVVTGCLAERYGQELAAELPEVDTVAPFGASVLAGLDQASNGSTVPVALGATRRRPDFDLLNLPRPASPRPWAYVKIAEGCDRACGFCAIPSFRGPQRSRSIEQILGEVEQLAVREVVLVAQDLAAYGRDQGVGERQIVPLIEQVSAVVDRVRLLYLYPSDLNEALIDAVLASGTPYFDLSLQHVSAPLLRRMRRWGDGERFLDRIVAIRQRSPEAAFRSNFIVGYPGETESDHDALLDFVDAAQLDWCGFFAYSPEAGTHAVTLDGEVPAGLRDERLAELRERQDQITETKRDLLVGQRVEVLVDEPGVGRSHREAPEIDGVMLVPDHLAVGEFHQLTVTAAVGADVEAS
jgi:ribosomal protein S12 methylthiotransferase